MVTIRDLQGNDLTAGQPLDQVLTASSTGTVYRMQALVAESDPLLPVRTLNGTIAWNDGGQPTVFNGSGTIHVDETRVLRPGKYLIGLSARNFEVGRPSTAGVNFRVDVLPPLSLGVPERLIYGPVLPRDQGFPSSRDWLFHSSSDIFVLESSAKMLLTTARGERVMEPEYGTNIRRHLFEAATASIDALLQQEITEALARWEPRLELQFFRVDQPPNAREATVYCTLVSKLNGQGFEVALYFQA